SVTHLLRIVLQRPEVIKTMRQALNCMARFKLSKRYPHTGEAWKKGELRQLGKTADSRLAGRRKRTIQETVAEREARRIALPTGPRRWTAREIKLIGTMSDAELGRRLRRLRESVRSMRRALHIRAFKPLKIKRWTLPEIRLLGVLPDREIARRLKRSVMSVRHKRRHLNI